MKALVLTSTNLRHRFFAQQVSRYFDVAAVICEEKKDYYVKQREESAVVQEHFEKNIAAERVYFHDLPSESSVSVVTVVDIMQFRLIIII